MTTEYKNTFSPDQEEWVSTLETTKMLQGKYTLREEFDDPDYLPRYCCLGILCKINNVLTGGNDSLESISQIALREKLFMSGRAMILLIDLNDELSKTFPEIAEEIRTNPHLYFANFDPPSPQ